jgi:hypothetical protein
MNREEIKKLLRYKMPNGPVIEHIEEIVDFLYDHNLVIVGHFEKTEKD